jgi:hypothetical protein
MVNLDRSDRRAFLEKPFGEHTPAGTDFENPVARCYACMLHNSVGDTGVDQKVLSKALLWLMNKHATPLFKTTVSPVEAGYKSEKA